MLDLTITTQFKVHPVTDTQQEIDMQNLSMTKNQWVELFRDIGLDEATMSQWHQLFEQRYPEQHQAFLEWLQIPSEEVSQIRKASR